MCTTIQASWGCLERCVRPCLDLMHSLSQGVGNSYVHQDKANLYCHNHASNQQASLLLWRVPIVCGHCAKHGRERSKKHTFCSRKDQSPVEWERASNWEPEKSLWKGLKRMAQFNTWQYFLSRNQDPKSQAKVWSWVVIGCSVIHYLPPNSQLLLWTFGSCQPSLPFSSWFPMRIPSSWRLLWR